VVWLPLVLLAIPSVVIGYLTVEPMLYGDLLKDSIAVDSARHPAMQALAKEFHGPAAMAWHGLTALPFWLALAGVGLAYVFYMLRPDIPAALKQRFGFIYKLLDNKYYMDWINENILARAARVVGAGLWKGGDVGLIDGVAVDGSAQVVRAAAGLVRLLQSGYLYWYALVMIMGVIGLMTWQLWPFLGSLLGR
jgi:NADH-quinone oxidoreductase subunit L